MTARSLRRALPVVIGALAPLTLAQPAASASLTANQLKTVEAAPPSEARLPTAAVLVDDHGERHRLGELLQGRPAVLILADYTCRNLCGPILAIAAASLRKTGLAPNKDFRLVVIGLDPKDSAADAQAMKRKQIGDGALAAASVFLLPDQSTEEQIAHALGYRAVYDAATDQFAHPATVFVLTPDGRVARTLSALGLDATGLRLALVEAGQGKVGGLVDHLRLLCYGFDAATGIYTLTIRRWLAVASALTVIVVAGGIGYLLVSRRPAEPGYPPQNSPSERA
jgi:protein SCO1/2